MIAIRIPECPEFETRKRYRRSIYPVATDVGWYTEYYSQLDDEEILTDLCLRLSNLAEDYYLARDEGYLEESVLEKNKIQENVIHEEYEKLWRYLPDESNQIYFRSLSKMTLEKAKFLEMMA
jgi:hypothetical protein